MIACTLSNLELRGIIESAFLPLRCNCTVMEDVMTMEVIDPATERVELVASNIALDTLDNSHALCVLIRELQAELEKTDIDDLRRRTAERGSSNNRRSTLC